jgi:hypothetical protein
VTSVKDLDDAKKILSVKEATDNLITEADDLFNENKYKELYELLYPYKVMFFSSQQILCKRIHNVIANNGTHMDSLFSI